MTIPYEKKIRKLLSEIKRLRLENENLRRAAGIPVGEPRYPETDEVLVSAEEKQALLSKIS